MRKSALLIALVTAVGVVLIGVALIRHESAVGAARAERLVHDLQQLRTGASDYKAAQAIAARFGIAPYDPRYKENCVFENFDSCTYELEMNNSLLERLLQGHPLLRTLNWPDWFGSASIRIQNRVVAQYSFFIWYQSSDGMWRGVSAGESAYLPKYEPYQARLSDGYSVERNDRNIRDRRTSFMLKSSLSPSATAAEWQHAWNFRFSCLDRKRGCGEICEVMPDAWRDYYDSRGRLDVERIGSAYLFCGHAPK